MKSLLPTVAILLLGISIIPAQKTETTIKECKISIDRKVKYKLVSIGTGIREPYITGLRIVVKEPFYNSADMIQLTKSVFRNSGKVVRNG